MTFDDSRAEPIAAEESAAAADAAVARFRECRWHDEVDGGAEFCRHGDVLPYAGRNGFNPRAWCPECTFYKARRKARRRGGDLDDFDF